MNKYILAFILVFVNITLFSQEILIDCGNPFLKKYSEEFFKKNPVKSIMAADTLELPFFDDFANSYVYPDQLRWKDRFAFINNDYAIDPISIGVATLDAVNEFGQVYPHLNSISSNIADSLTSQPINLDYPLSDSIYLSFYYQAGGKGNAPEANDSLVLQFKVPDSEWQSVWNVGGGERMTNFELVLLPVEEKYLQKGFQFRFLNYASISGNQEPSWRSNSDIWNIDYIELDRNRSFDDTLANDVAFIYNFQSIIEDYESVPWTHYKQFPGNLMKDSVDFIYKNTWNATYNIERNFLIHNYYTSAPVCQLLRDSENIGPLETIEYNKYIDCLFPSASNSDSASFIITGYIITDTVSSTRRYRWNDTIRYSQDFFNYYSYDDGTAETGYGIIGTDASVAYKFSTLVADSLKGVFIYFNQVLEESNRKNFYLTVWDDNGGKPGNIIQQIEGIVPEYSNELNKYVYYPLDSAAYIPSTFYIGWVKTTNDVLNCGFDLNRNAKDKLFYNVSGEWYTSQFEGALMVRPAFGYHPAINNVEDHFVDYQDYDIYPNPVTDILNISCDDRFQYFEIYDTSGKLLFSQYNTDTFDTGSLQQGMYFIQLKSDSKVFKTKKFMVLR